MIYVNGEGFSAASYSAAPFAYAAQDPIYQLKGKSIHPRNFDASYSKFLSNALHQSLRNDAYINSDWRKILRETYQILGTNDVRYLVITWPNFYRGEVLYNNSLTPFVFDDAENTSLPNELRNLIFEFFSKFDLFDEETEFCNATQQLTKDLESKNICHAYMMADKNMHHNIFSDNNYWLFNPNNNTLNQWAVDNNLISNTNNFLSVQGHKELGKILMTHLTNQL